MAKVDLTLTVKDVRGSFLQHLLEPQKRTNDDGKLTGYNFSGNFLFPKLVDGEKNPTAEMLGDAIKQAIEAKWPGQNKKIPAANRCVIDGEPKDEDTGEREPLYDGYEGMYVLKAGQSVTIEEWEEQRHNPIQLLGPKKDKDGKFPRLKGAEAKKLFYSGAFFDVVVRIYGYDGSAHGYANRVSASLEAVKFKRHGQAFGAAPVDADALFDEEDDDDLGDGIDGAAVEDDDDDLLG